MESKCFFERYALLWGAETVQGEDLFSWRKDPVLLVPFWGKNERLVEAKGHHFAKMSVSSRRGAPKEGSRRGSYGAQRPYKERIFSHGEKILFSWCHFGVLMYSIYIQKKFLSHINISNILKNILLKHTCPDNLKEFLSFRCIYIHIY